MSKLKLALSLCFAALLSGSLMAGDFTGKWSGTVLAKTADGEVNHDAAYMSFKQTGNVLTGTAGGDPNRQSEITEGKVDGEELSFKVAVGEAVASVKLRFDGERLKGEATIETPDGKVTAALDLKRVP